ncbi:MAG TPA: RagB/SusD family nutrient uptake outer membrane protein, partial [Flavitalea sp.]|nr:RagB/SusD family nutrient uptake outer membrane protein [Flavitalea sp.]
MKKYKRQGIALIISIIVTGASCTKLQEKPTSFVNPDIYYSTINQAETVLTGSMQTLWDYWGDGYSWGWRYFINDDQMDGGDLNIPFNHAEALWNLHYKNILNLNTLIKHVKAGSIKDGSPDDVALVLGLAKFIRGYNYFQLVRLYGDVPLYTDETEDPSINPMA